MNDLRQAAQMALEALEKQHRDRTAYSAAKQAANATCAEFRENTLSDLIESGYRHSQMGKATVSAIDTLRSALAAEPQPNRFDYMRLIREDFEARMRAEGFSGAALSRLDSGAYLSPRVQEAWVAEKRTYTVQRRIPEGWELESSVGQVNGERWMTIRNTKTQCGQDVYQSDDPLMYGFLAALYEAPIKEPGNA